MKIYHKFFLYQNKLAALRTTFVTINGNHHLSGLHYADSGSDL